ncbi:branched-chain amino acid ABC transporter permease [Ramlibacter sp. WS9]|uniref:branched-chain amino acid ABC transporter permease n=1 Tax=Ramlibacter sp. WS9 TaxID=1882741 RepID=UPI001141D435|nr:branched-chain amino acid ABC transporter permease [Ramlibacter sp. WS9]ROZ75269.1 branched-chain amino acid ABC transporter permease [Ramlibacter sp. WS9]
MTHIIELIAGGLIVGGIYAVVAMGLNLQYGLMRIMNISHGEFLMVGAYLTWLGHTMLGLNPLATLPLVAAALFLGGLGIYALCFRRVVREAPSVEIIESRSLLIGFGLMFLVQNAALLIWGADLRGYSFLSDSVQVAGARFGANRLLVFGFAIAASLALLGVLRYTLLGKSVRAMMQSPVGAQLVGIDTRVLHPVVFGAGLALAGVAGSLISMVYELSPSMGEPYTVTALIVITLGGLGSAMGCLVGGLLLGLVEALGMYFFSPSIKMLLSYAVFITVLLARPQGLFAR